MCCDAGAVLGPDLSFDILVQVCDALLYLAGAVVLAIDLDRSRDAPSASDMLLP